ncbi:MAG: L,D-transpeptidase family protein [Rubrimonas sp.]|uniref:L,D-transpeptidase family protein n=1 Tax=Rubrimonas sp. TaxID=2036015 RepID=UPI002FDDF04F
MLRFLPILALSALAACAAPRVSAPPSSLPIVVAEAPTLSPFEAALREIGAEFRPPARGKAVLVNIPAFELIAFEDGEPVMTSRVIVGTPRTQTPVLDTAVSAVRFRPTWRPTPSMIASGEYEDRVWPAGPRNPLGLAAIRLEPGLLVYLHDTNRPALFERDARALSHGCVRTEKWDALAAWILDISVEEVLAHANGRRSFDMAPPTPVPVFLRYHTEFPDADGAIRRHRDIYRRDASLVASSGEVCPMG